MHVLLRQVLKRRFVTVHTQMGIALTRHDLSFLRKENKIGCWSSEGLPKTRDNRVFCNKYLLISDMRHSNPELQ